MDNLLFYCHMGVVVVVGHWNQCCVGQSPAKASGANLGHYLVEKTSVDGLRLKDFWILLENRHEQPPLRV